MIRFFSMISNFNVDFDVTTFYVGGILQKIAKNCLPSSLSAENE